MTDVPEIRRLLHELTAASPGDIVDINGRGLWSEDSTDVFGKVVRQPKERVEPSDDLGIVLAVDEYVKGLRGRALKVMVVATGLVGWMDV